MQAETVSIDVPISSWGHLDSSGGLEEAERWLAVESDRQSMLVRRVPFAELDRWGFGGDPLMLRHDTGGFFTIEGIQVQTDFGVQREWEQPIINQPEVGILGVLTKVQGGRRYFLMQAKVEPGNVNGVQVSPTVQATFSNYKQKHGGNVPAYLEYFVPKIQGHVIVDQLQSEQASRFIAKRNRNMVIEVDGDIPVLEGFRWLELATIKALLRRNNVVNMDARTVLACLPFSYSFEAASGIGSLRNQNGLALDGFGRELARSALSTSCSNHSIPQLLQWLTDLRTRFRPSIQRRPLHLLKRWEFTENEIHHASRLFFSVIGVEVTAASREVSRWRQPLLSHPGYGLNGFLTKRVDGVLHFLVRACFYPGNREVFELGPTVSRSNVELQFGHSNAPPFLDLFDDPPKEWVRYAAVQSEEGGRFYHYQNVYVILCLPENEPVLLPENYRWMTLGQIQELNMHGYFNIESRNLLACLDFDVTESV